MYLRLDKFNDLGKLIYNKLQRVTSSGRFIPQIDGLRFIAIFSVFMFHVNEIIAMKDKSTYVDSPDDHALLRTYLSHGNYGVQLFFAISGFILALPFVQHYLTGVQRPSTKQYFLRRLTRLEPPYIVVMVTLFLYIVFIQHKYTFGQLIPSLLASLTYTHNFFFGRDILPLVNPVAWTLEIEVQFYILAPLLAAFFFKSGKAITRRIKIIAVILLFIVLQNLYVFPFRWLYDQIQFFLLGFLLADIYVEPLNFQISKWQSVFCGIFTLFSMWLYVPTSNDPFIQRIGWGIAFPTMIFIFYYLTMFTPFWKKLFSKKILVILGGMCYTIYLIHSPIISITTNYLVKYQFSQWYMLNYIFLSIILIIATLVGSSLFFVLIERPCMQKDWYRKFFFWHRDLQSINQLNMNMLVEKEEVRENT